MHCDTSKVKKEDDDLFDANASSPEKSSNENDENEVETKSKAKKIKKEQKVSFYSLVANVVVLQ